MVPQSITLDVSMMEYMKDGCYGLDEQWRIRYANRAAKVYLVGWQEASDTDIWALYPHLLGTVFEAELRQVAKQRLPSQFEMHSPISHRCFYFRVYPTTDGIVIFLQDITGQWSARQHLGRFNRSNLVSRIATGVAHEIRNPLTVVKGYLQILQGKYTTDTGKFESALAEVKQIEDLITDFLYVAKNKSMLQTVYNLNYIIEQQLKPIIQIKAIQHSVIVEYKLDELPEMLASQDEITQLLLQLIGNAMDASRPGGRILIQTSFQEGCIVLRVADEGEGIAPEHMEKIFDPFFSTRGERVGLGLAMSLGIIERHSGKIVVASEPGQGTTVTVRLPVLHQTACQ